MDNQTNVLAVLQLSSPACVPASGSELVFAPIAEDIAPATGTAVSARVRGPDGDTVFACDVGDDNSEAVIKLDSTKISAGRSVRIDAFKLSMP